MPEPPALPSEHRWRNWIPAVVMACVVFALSSIPGQRIPIPLAHGLDKVAHATLYAVLGAAIAHGLHRGRGVASPLRIVLTCMLFGAAYGASDEVHQLFTPHRSFEVLDGVADTIGSFLGALAYVGWWKLRAKQR